MNVVVVGAGYVGFPLAVGLSQKHTVSIVEKNKEKVEAINSGKSVLKEHDLLKVIRENGLSVKAVTDGKSVYKSADVVFIAVPTDWDEEEQFFNTGLVDSVIKEIRACSKALIVIKSTVPIGYTQEKCAEYKTKSILFSPEFSREGCAWYDFINPSRLIFGVSKGREEYAEDCLELYEGIINDKTPKLILPNTEAECIKLFSNTYLAMRVAFFNEVDNFASGLGLSSEDIISGIGLDKRIGSHYARPSFGYGGYCLPKDIKQLESQLNAEYSPIIQSISLSNERRLEYIGKYILRRGYETVGIYGLQMKPDSDNVRNSRAIELARWLKDHGCNVVCYDSKIARGCIPEDIYMVDTLEEFVKQSSVIVTDLKVDRNLFSNTPCLYFNGQN